MISRKLQDGSTLSLINITSSTISSRYHLQSLRSIPRNERSSWGDSSEEQFHSLNHVTLIFCRVGREIYTESIHGLLYQIHFSRFSFSPEPVLGQEIYVYIYVCNSVACSSCYFHSLRSKFSSPSAREFSHLELFTVDFRFFFSFVDFR